MEAAKTKVTKKKESRIKGKEKRHKIGFGIKIFHKKYKR